MTTKLSYIGQLQAAIARHEARGFEYGNKAALCESEADFSTDHLTRFRPSIRLSKVCASSYRQEAAEAFTHAEDLRAELEAEQARQNPFIFVGLSKEARAAVGELILIREPARKGAYHAGKISLPAA